LKEKKELSRNDGEERKGLVGRILVIKKVKFDV
jgi:hypothetical protein